MASINPISSSSSSSSSWTIVPSFPIAFPPNPTASGTPVYINSNNTIPSNYIYVSGGGGGGGSIGGGSYGIGGSGYAGTSTSSYAATINFDWEQSYDSLVFNWLLEQMKIDAMPLKVCPEICKKCLGNQFNNERLLKTKKIDCPHCSPFLFIWRDAPPDKCPYILEHTIELNNDAK